MYYTNQKLAEIKEYALGIYNEYKNKYQELRNSTHSLSEYTPVFSLYTGDHPFSIGRILDYSLYLEDKEAAENWMPFITPSLEKIDTPYAYLVCYYYKKTLIPFYSELMQVDERHRFEIFHRKKDNAVISAFYETSTGRLLRIHVEVFNKEDHSMEYMTITEEEQLAIGISNGLTADHAHFNLIDGHIQSVDRIEWFRLNLETIPPYDYVRPFPEGSGKYELFKPNPVRILTFSIKKWEKRKLIWYEIDADSADLMSCIDGPIDKETILKLMTIKNCIGGHIETETFFRYLDIMGIKWFDHLR